MDDLTFSRTLFDNTRRVCFSIQITEDVIFEEDETFSVRLIVNLPESDPSVIISKDTAVVTILANDGKHTEIELHCFLVCTYYLCSISQYVANLKIVLTSRGPTGKCPSIYNRVYRSEIL